MTSATLKLKWGEVEGVRGRSRYAALGERFVLYVDPPVRRSDVWRWQLYKVTPDSDATGRRGWLVVSELLVAAGTELQAMTLAEEAMARLAGEILGALTGGAR